MDILHRVGIKASSDEVYAALATIDGVAGWLTSAEGDSKVGGRIKLRFLKADGHEIGRCEAKVLELRPAARVLWHVFEGPADWIGTTIAFELKQVGDYCIVLFRHTDWKQAREHMHHASTKWAIFLMSLKALIETGQGSPTPRDVQVGDWS
jgi:uncharacterized protein YndB with AHSA1/START domain